MTTGTREKRDAACSWVQAASAVSGSVPRFSKFSGVKRNYIIVFGRGSREPCAKGSCAGWCIRAFLRALVRATVPVKLYFDRYIRRPEVPKEKALNILFPFLHFHPEFWNLWILDITIDYCKSCILDNKYMNIFKNFSKCLCQSCVP